ncbi:hypothetical protein [Oxalobacter paraformigenes]|uniref:hypothetical protein n=1 Tax=Oxalobacter paraformigenes TaxID=556268 RepID=UPI0005949C6A|nr:hypothetical protein [Oxalobacter paraformigenes]
MIAADPAFFSIGLKGRSEHRLMGVSAPARRNGIAKAAGISEKRSGAAFSALRRKGRNGKAFPPGQPAPGGGIKNAAGWFSRRGGEKGNTGQPFCEGRPVVAGEGGGVQGSACAGNTRFAGRDNGNVTAGIDRRGKFRLGLASVC